MAIQREEIIGPCRLILGDCLEVLPLIGRVDAVVTDPPYGIGYNATGGVQLAARRKYATNTIVGDEKPFDPSPFLSLGGRQILWGADHFRERLPQSGRFLVWHKRCERDPASAERLDMADAEIAWDSGGKLLRVIRHVWDGFITDSSDERVHPTQKPVRVMEWTLDIASIAGVVLDPFMGSGTTGVACIRTGRNFIGIEREPKYFDIAVSRIRRAWQDKQSEIKFDEPPAPKQLSLMEAE